MKCPKLKHCFGQLKYIASLSGNGSASIHAHRASPPRDQGTNPGSVRVLYPSNTRHRPLTQSIDSKHLVWMTDTQTTEGLACPRHANQAMRRRSEGKGKGLTLVELTN